MKTLFCDASFDPHYTKTETGDAVRGKIGISDGENINIVEKVAVGKVPDLKQYINVFELIAIARSIEIAAEKMETRFPGWTDVLALEVMSDSSTAVYWSRNGRTNPKVFTQAHGNALAYLRDVKDRIKIGVIFTHVPREKNPAGFLLAKELRRESPHA